MKTSGLRRSGGMAGAMARGAALALACTVLATALPASAQFRGGYGFIKAVEDRDGDKVTEMLKDPDVRLINTRHPDTGESALAIVVKRRDLNWVKFLLGKGADPKIADRQDVTPLMHAATLGFVEAADEMLKKGAPVDQANRRGETALILAVQRKDAAMVRLLVRSGANPDKSDHITGLSARDYARRDDRSGQMLTLLDAKPDAPVKPMGEVFGPK